MHLVNCEMIICLTVFVGLLQHCARIKIWNRLQRLLHSDVQFLEIISESDMEQITQRVYSNVHCLTLHVEGIEQRSSCIIMHWCRCVDLGRSFIIRRYLFKSGIARRISFSVYRSLQSSSLQSNQGKSSFRSFTKQCVPCLTFLGTSFSFILVTLINPNPALQPA